MKSANLSYNRDQEYEEMKLPCVTKKTSFFFFYNKHRFKNVQCTSHRGFLLYPRSKDRRTTFIVFQREIEQKKIKREKEKIEFENKEFLNSIIFLSWNETGR